MCIQNASFEVIRINIFSLGVVSDWWRACLTNTPGVIGDGTKRCGFERTNASAVRELHEKNNNFTSLLRFLWTFRLSFLEQLKGYTIRTEQEWWDVWCLQPSPNIKSVGYESGNFITLHGFLDLNFPSHFGARGSVILKHESFKKPERIYHFHIAVLSTWAPSAKIVSKPQRKGPINILQQPQPQNFIFLQKVVVHLNLCFFKYCWILLGNFGTAEEYDDNLWVRTYYHFPSTSCTLKGFGKCSFASDHISGFFRAGWLLLFVWSPSFWYHSHNFMKKSFGKCHAVVWS